MAHIQFDRATWACACQAQQWLQAFPLVDALLAVGVPGLTPAEGRALAEMVVGRPLAAPESALVQEIGELIGWHPAALRLAAIEGRELGWAGPLAELQAGRLPWAAVRQAVLRQWDRLPFEQQVWLKTLSAAATANAAFSTDEAAQWWQVAPAVARRQLWLLQGGGLVVEAETAAADAPRWRVAPIARRVLVEDAHWHEQKCSDGQ